MRMAGFRPPKDRVPLVNREDFRKANGKIDYVKLVTEIDKKTGELSRILERSG